MALFNTPQYIDVEDKVAGPLTVKQLGWMLLMFGILVVMWLSIASKVLFTLAAIPIVLFFTGLAFLKVYGQTMISLLIAGISFVMNPKIYVWRRVSNSNVKTNIKEKQKESMEASSAKQHEDERKKMLKNLSGLAQIMDSGGANANADTISILKKTRISK